jgi:hypothetical protein
MKFGRRPRGHDQRIPKLSAIGGLMPLLPPEINYAAGMPANLGAMLNNSLGDCTCAACGHAIQTWSFNSTGTMVTPPDADIESLYEEAGDYIPGQPNTDNGAVIQTVLTDWMNGPIDGNELTAFVEIDQLSVSNIQRSIYECGVVDIGFDVPSFMPMNAGATWDVNASADNTIIGGHSVDLVGYQADGTYIVISWGQLFYMTPAFMAKFCDEAYGLINAAWITASGHSPAGLTIVELEALMQSMIWDPSDESTHAHHRHHHKHRRHRHHR